ncbi:AAA domain-containing protein [Acholeplasma hippikon]|uniref:Putative DNA helicase n=1 Tax=Acholeplasma hippikon TaxID=264636 RepID=A0A449BJ23_9MOLU|nr:AAA domain-containing protein [Acholeplasma hippikon]VEU82438.1 putative DNA helicase [Acholeplasma hippikon]
MALRKNDLLDALDKLRDEIRLEQEALTLTKTEVCTDLALKEMADKKPVKITDFQAVGGLDSDFLTIYAQRFLEVIKSYQEKNTQSVKVSKSAYQVLHHYKDRLADISKSNPNLYVGKIEQIHSFDLFNLSNKEEIIEFLSNARVKNLKLGLTEESLNTHLTKLYREVNKTFRETGAYNLYIIYPFVEGYFTKEKFPIKAPLLYFPVKLERTLKTFTIKKDNDRDIIFNRDLVLLSSKIERSKLDSEMPHIEVYNDKILKEIVIPYYEKHGIKIEVEDTELLTSFKNELKDDFTKVVDKKRFILKHYVTLSRFKLYSSSIQKDIETILSQNKYNDLLEGLIDETNLFQKEKSLNLQVNKEPIDEQKITYINDLNFSQEKVVEMLNEEKKVVIWGPPGTGKSQTITSLIASSVLKGENVLVVSEKKVALDVIYSRLKKVSKYAMFIDDAENKQDFYYKLKRFLEPEPPVRTLNNDVYALDQKIKSIIADMDHSLKLLYESKIDDVPLHKLFERYIKDKDVILNLTPKVVHQTFMKYYSKLSFKLIDSLEKVFDTDQHLKKYLELAKVYFKYPWILKLETKISRSSKVEFKSFDERYENFKHELQYKTFFGKKRFIKSFITENRMILNFLTKKKSLDNIYLKTLIKDDSLHQYIKENLSSLDKYFYQFNLLTFEQKMFLKMIINEPMFKEIDDITKLRKYIFDSFYSGYLEKFIADNQKHLYVINEYKEKAEALEVLMEEKRQLSIESFEMELYKQALAFSNTRRIMDIKRILESNQKPSVKTFIDTYLVEVKNHIRLWMMTPEVVSAVLPLEHGMFDLVIFDEASQMYVEKGIPSIYRAKKVVVAGDPKQLRPSNLGVGRVEDEDELFEDDVLKDVSLDAKSLLDLARYRFKETLLNYHYRSQYEELIAFSNHAFYDAKLIVSPNQTPSSEPPIEYVYVKNATFDARKNMSEAKAVVDLVKKIFNERKHNESIGIITFNSSQRDAIENLIDKELFKKGIYQKQFEQEMFRKDDNEDTSLFIKNIENVQGDERDIIIFSMGYAKSKDGRLMRRFGWLNHEGGQNRLNVAITRAKKKIYFVSSLYPEEFKVDDLTSTGPKLLKDFMRYCYFVSNRNHEMTKEVLNQLYQTEVKTQEALKNLMSEEIKNRIEKIGYKVDSEVGIGKHKINLAVKSKQNNGYLLGLVCDLNVDSPNARRDLIHQDKFLKSRNWNLYHVFESNWYTNSNKEIKQIRELIKQAEVNDK